MNNQPKYKRVLLKISGEALSSEGNIFDDNIISGVCEQIKKVHELGVDIGIVVGGGNIWRGRHSQSFDRTTSDQMGMLATCINALALRESLEMIGVETRVMSALDIPKVAEPYIQKKAISHLEKGRVVIFACGTGSPYFSTDTGATLRANEIDADIILLAKNVDAVYDKDPKIYADAKRISDMQFIDILAKDLKVMDSTAASMCKDNNMPILVFGLNQQNSIVNAVLGQSNGTIIH